MDTPALLPVSLQLQGKQCLVVGGNASAEQRVRTLLACEARVLLVSPEVTPALRALAQQGIIVWESVPFHPAHLTAAAVVLVTTSDAQQNAWIATLAKQQRCLISVTDMPALCDFYMPAIVRRGHLTLAISTEGQAPAFASWLRKYFERVLDSRLGETVARYALMRSALRRRYPDFQQRAKAWAQILTQDPPPVLTPEQAEAPETHPTQTARVL